MTYGATSGVGKRLEMLHEKRDCDSRTIKVSGTARITAPSDITTVSVQLSGVEPEYKDAVDELTSVISKLRKCVAKAGLDEDVLRTDTFSVKQNYKRVYGKEKSYNDYKDIPDGFKYETRAYFEFPNDTDILTAAVYGIMKLKVTPRITFGFRNSDPGKLREDALREATKHAMAEARIIVETTGHKLGRLLSVNPNSGYYEEEFDDSDARRDMVMDCCCEEEAIPLRRIEVRPTDDSKSATVTLEWEIAD